MKNRPCPQCKEHGRDKTGNHLFLMRDGFTWHCTRCNYTESNLIEVEPIIMTNTFTKVDLPIKSIPERFIKEDTCKKYNVMTEFSEETREPSAHYYPITRKGNLVAYKIRKLPKQFYTSGDMKGTVDLFGQSVCPTSGKRLLITGGELDCLACFQLLHEKYPTFNHAVVSLPKGENAAAIADNLEFIRNFDEVIIYTDMDDTGRKCADDIAKIIGPKAKIMSTTEKDACDMLIKNKKTEFYNAFYNAQQRRPEGIIAGAEVDIEELMEEVTKGYELQYPQLNRMLGGLRKGELTTLTAGSGVGKSTLAREIGYHLRSKHDLTIGNIFLEETLTKTIQGYIAIDKNISLARLRNNPALLSREDWKSSYDRLIAHKWFAFSHFGSLPTNELLDKMRHLVYGEGCDFVILDHLSLVFSGQANDNERLAIDNAMTELASFCNESGAGIIVIVHLSRNKNKGSFNEGAHISLNDLRGSAALEQLSWNVIGLERDQQNENNDLATIRILKSRENGWTGVADTCQYNMETGRLLPYTVTL